MRQLTLFILLAISAPAFAVTTIFKNCYGLTCPIQFLSELKKLGCEPLEATLSCRPSDPDTDWLLCFVDSFNCEQTPSGNVVAIQPE